MNKPVSKTTQEGNTFSLVKMPLAAAIYLTLNATAWASDLESRTHCDYAANLAIESVQSLKSSDFSAAGTIRLVGTEALEADHVSAARVSDFGMAAVNWLRKSTNLVENAAARSSLNINLNDYWSTESFAVGEEKNFSSYLEQQPNVGDYTITTYLPETQSNNQSKAVMLMQGKNNNFDVLQSIADSDHDLQAYSEYYFEYYIEESVVVNALVLAESGLLATQTQFNNIKARIAALRSSERGDDHGLAFGSGLGGLTGHSLMLTPVNNVADKQSESISASSPWGFFAAGTFSRGDNEQGVFSPSSDFRMHGITAGIDYRLSDQWIVGGTLGYTQQNIDLTNLSVGTGSVDTKSLGFSVYTTYFNKESWYFDSVLSYGRNDHELRRDLGFLLAQADPGGSDISFASSFGRDFNKGAWSFGPYGRLQYSHLSFDSFTDNASFGGFDALVVDVEDVTRLSTVIGGKLNYTHSAGWGVFIPHFQLEWQHEYRNDPAIVNVSLLSDPTILLTSNGDSLDSNSFRLGLGASFVLTGGRSGFIFYEKMLGNNRTSQDSLALGIRIEF